MQQDSTLRPSPKGSKGYPPDLQTHLRLHYRRNCYKAFERPAMIVIEMVYGIHRMLSLVWAEKRKVELGAEGRWQLP